MLKIKLISNRIFLYQTITFKIELPNEETIKAMENVRKGKNLEEVEIGQLKEEAKQCLR